MPSVGQITREKRVTAHVVLDEGVEVDLVFDRNSVTPAWVASAEKRDEVNDAQSIPKALAEIILSWDVTDDDGIPFPPTAENLAVFSYPVQAALLEGVMKAAIPSRAEGNSSATGSSASELPVASSGLSSPTSPNGSESTTSQNVSASPSSS